MAEIKQAKFIDQTGQEKDAVFIGAEKAIYDDSGKRLDQKLEEREKATGLLASDTQGILGSIGTEVSLQTIIDKLAEKIMRELVSNSSLTQTLANYMTTAMMSGEQINDGNKVPTSALAFAMNQAITQNKNAITQLNSELDILNYTGTTNSSGVLDLPLKSKYIISIIILTPQDCIGLYGTSGSSTWIKVLKYDMSVAGDTSVSVSILYSNK